MIRNVKNALTFTLGLTFLIGCASHQPPEPEANVGPELSFNFEAREHENNELIGKFWSPVTQNYISWQQVDRFLPDGGWLFIGESLGHPDNERIATYLIEHLGRSGRLGAVALEVMNTEQQELLDEHLGERNIDEQELNWNPQVGEWNEVEGILEASLRYASRVIGADMSNENKNKVRTSQREVAHYSAGHSDYLANLIYRQFCQVFTQEQAAEMVDVHIARDQFIAAQIMGATVPSAVNVFIGEKGRIRTDYGVPVWLAEDINVRTLALVPVAASENPQDYVGSTYSGLDPAQLFYFIPGFQESSACAGSTAN
ncbi:MULTISPECIES: ChaN family lipoprotein [Gammaproteobacteria]|uniref:ChaN family lipoprotein n=1 Tax=Gammaproteobacteria TaxID=1236 RepID=UPI001402A78D|nr:MULTISPECIES: ChaN family lipoprotein [Gammaproteobacteria]